jgi:diphthamide biosynthesis protein 4
LWTVYSEENSIPSNTVKYFGRESDVEESSLNWPHLLSKSGGYGDGDLVFSRFIRVQKAWEVLRDSEARAEYDNHLRRKRLAQEIETTRIIGDEIHMQDMESCSVDPDHGSDLEYSYPCRCGDFIVVSQEELEMAGVEVKDVPTSTACGGTRAGMEFDRPRSNSLVLPCQSCSMHIRLLFNS